MSRVKKLVIGLGVAVAAIAGVGIGLAASNSSSSPTLQASIHQGSAIHATTLAPAASSLPTMALQGNGTGEVTCNGNTLDLGLVSRTAVFLTCSPTSNSTTTTTAPPSTTTTTAGPTTTTTSPPSTTTTTTPVSGACAPPYIYSTSNAEGTINTDPSGTAPELWWVNNDAWNGSAGPQTLNVCSASSWNAVSNQTNNGGAVETYPDTEYDIGGRGGTGVNSTTPISGYSGGTITSTFSEAYPSAGGWDAAYDLWTDNWGNESMVWNAWAGNNSYWATCAASTTPKTTCGDPQSAQNVNIGGVEYNFLANGSGATCTAANEKSCELMFFRQSQVSSGSVNLLDIFNWEVANGYAASTDVPTQLTYGVEISYTSGTETFPMTGLTFTVAT